MTGALDGLTVVDLSATLAGIQISQTLCDFGVDVVMVEPPGGHPLRSEPAWPFWARGKKSIEVNLKGPAGLARVKALAEGADVVLETWRPGVAERLGLGYDDLVEANPGLVYCSVTGFGRDNPLSNIKAYEPIVMAKVGALDAFSVLSDRPGPTFVASPYCSFSASQIGLHGILAALVERESSGLGQRVETTMVQSLLAHDTWNWLVRLLTVRYADAFTAVAPASAPASSDDSDEDEPAPLTANSIMFLMLLVGFTKDGRYMQFSQASPRLFEAFAKLLGLDKLLQDGLIEPDDPLMVEKWRRIAIDITRQKTYDEWVTEFDREPDVWAEMFRHGTELLHHPQLVQDGRIATIDDPDLGPVLQPGPLVAMEATPAELGQPAPALDAHRDLVTPAEAHLAAAGGEAPTGAPLEGLTIVELGTFYAAPFGATVLADLGARVIKIEQLDGDPIRSMMLFPEVSGIKVLQGKESVAVDMASDEGREIVLELVRRADVVLQSFRGGVAQRHGYTSDDLLAVNPNLVYLNAPGYGTSPPYGHRPAFAPTIGAGSGLAYRNLGGPHNVSSDPSLTTEQIAGNSTRLAMATMAVGTADGFSALGVGTALLLGILAKKRGAPGQAMATSMLSTMSHCLSEDMVEYENRPELEHSKPDLRGLNARYRLYETTDGWVFLAAPSASEWEALAGALDFDTHLADNDDQLAVELEARFKTDSAAAWEQMLLAVDVACVEVATGPVEEVFWFGGEMGETLGFVTEANHPVLETYPRLGPLVTMSRSECRTGDAPLCGQDTDAVVGELGYDDDAIAKLKAAGILG
jgi:crotonobetainyl-CoA:carnitine CoA-transferase CaiB-like acyl-CoA transferase